MIKYLSVHRFVHKAFVHLKLGWDTRLFRTGLHAFFPVCSGTSRRQSSTVHIFDRSGYYYGYPLQRNRDLATNIDSQTPSISPQRGFSTAFPKDPVHLRRALFDIDNLQSHMRQNGNLRTYGQVSRRQRNHSTPKLTRAPTKDKKLDRQPEWVITRSPRRTMTHDHIATTPYRRDIFSRPNSGIPWLVVPIGEVAHHRKKELGRLSTGSGSRELVGLID